MASDWRCVPRDYAISKNPLQGYQTFEHPLKLTTVTVMESKGTRGKPVSSNSSSRTSSTVSLIDPLGFALDGTDPLSQFARQEQELMDPLSQIASDYETSFKKSRKRDTDIPDDITLCWSLKRLGILNRFTTSERLSISTSFLSSGGAGTSGEIIKAQTVLADKVKYRLEQLDDFEDDSMKHMMDLTQQEYILRIEQLNHELVHSWNGDQRVKALKIAIQCSKMLADTSVLQFYPSQYVLITDILDIFGKLVYERLRAKADLKVTEKKFGLESIRESAKETCQNWFFKIASIRELLPRLYVEMAILKCYGFLSQYEFGQALTRITRMIRGIGDPLVATYARCYLVRVGLSVSADKEYIRENFNDFLAVYHVIFNGSVRSELNRQRIDITNYLALYGPALDWILQALVRKQKTYSDEVLNKCKDVRNNGPLLISILNSFKPEFIALNATEFVQILSTSSTEGISKAHLFRALGSSISKCPPSAEQRPAVLKAAFATINTFTDANEYIGCVETWTQFTAEHFPIKGVNILLGEINSRMSQNKNFEQHYPQLQSIIDKILIHCKEFVVLLTLEHFLPFLDLFQKESTKLDVCKNIMTIYKNNYLGTTSDPVVTNTLMYICKVLNDSVTALTVEDERRQIGNLISDFVNKVDYGRDFEQQLTFYAEARAAFPNLDAVITTLVYSVNKLAIETRRIVNGMHTRKTAAFAKACAAYCFITIPSIDSVATQMDLYHLTGQVALLNFCLGQADSCFEAALQLVADLPQTIEIEGKLKSTESYLVSYLCNMLSTLVVVPDSPEQGALYLARLLLDVLKKFPFDLHSTGPIIVYLHTLDMLYVQSLEVFPYHIPNVVSNDDLYGSDPKFIAEVNNICSQIVDHILSQLKSLGFANQLRTQATLALDLMLRIVRYADLGREKTFQLALNLWHLALKHEGCIETKSIANALESIEEIQSLTTPTNEQRSRRLAELIAEMKNK